jgi:hypothetical protein
LSIIELNPIPFICVLCIKRLQLKFCIVQVLEKDLAIFGFFIALGRSTRTFLLANGFDTLDDPIEDSIRYYYFCYVLLPLWFLIVLGVLS